MLLRWKVLNYAYFVISSPNCLLFIWGFAQVELPWTSEDMVNGEDEECEGDYCLIGHYVTICVKLGVCVCIPIFAIPLKGGQFMGKQGAT